MTQEQELARFLAVAVFQLGGSLKISKELLDNMLPTRLLWDTTSDPEYVTVAVISNDVIQLLVEPTPSEEKVPVVPSPEHDLAPPPESDPVIQQETRGHDEPETEED